MSKKLLPLAFCIISLVFFSSCESEQPIQTFSLKITISPENSGKIHHPTSPIKQGEAIELIPFPEPNWVFKQWEMDASGSTNPLRLVMDSNKNITGVFVKKEYSLSIEIQGEGTVNEKIVENPSGREYPHGTLVELIPNAKEGWVFSTWLGDFEGDTVPLRITVKDTTNLTAIFIPKTSAIILGGSEDDVVNKIIKISGGKYLLAGTTTSNDGIFEGLNHGGQDAFIIQLNSDLKVQWVKVIGGSQDETATSIIENKDGSYSLTGSFTSSDGNFSGKLRGTSDIFHLKLDQSGNTIWLKSFGTRGTTLISKSIIQAQGGPYILLATSDGECCNEKNGSNNGGKDIILVYINEIGDLLWTNNYGTYRDEEASALYEKKDGSLIILGTQQPKGAVGKEDLFVIGTDPYGNGYTSAIYSGSGSDIGFDIKESLENNSIIVVGTTTSTDGDFQNYSFGKSNIFVLQLAPSGTGVGNTKSFGGSQNDSGHALLKLSDNDFYFLGSSDSQDFDMDGNHMGGLDLVLIKTDSYLNKKWLKSFGGTGDEGWFPKPFGEYGQSHAISSMVYSHDSGLILTGTTNSNDMIFEGMKRGKKDIFIIKTDLEGKL